MCFEGYKLFRLSLGIAGGVAGFILGRLLIGMTNNMGMSWNMVGKTAVLLIFTIGLAILAFTLYMKACGRSGSAVMRHVFRNSLQSSLTALGMSLPKLVAGTFVVECIFVWPGLGRLCVTAIFNRDYPVIQAYVLLMAVLFVVCNLLMDVFSALVDPRLRERGLN